MRRLRNNFFLSFLLFDAYTSRNVTVIIDLLIRLGYITPDNEPDFMKIITRLHGRFDFENLRS